MQELALNVLHELSKKMARKRKVIYIRKWDCVWLNAEVKCSSWIVKEDGQEKKSNIYKKMRLRVT